MPSADPRATQMMATIIEFEESVTTAETALVIRDWPRIDEALADQHRLTHALVNLIEETHDARPQRFTDEVSRRIHAISERRADQLRRLTAFSHLVRERLTVISRMRELRRVGGESEPQPLIFDTMQ